MLNGNKIEKAQKVLIQHLKDLQMHNPALIYGKYHLKLKSGDKYIILIDIYDIDDENKERGIFQLDLLTFSKMRYLKVSIWMAVEDDYGVFIYNRWNSAIISKLAD